MHGSGCSCWESRAEGTPGNHCCCWLRGGQRGKGAHVLKAGQLGSRRVALEGFPSRETAAWSGRRKNHWEDASASCTAAAWCEWRMLGSGDGFFGGEQVMLGSKDGVFGVSRGCWCLGMGFSSFLQDAWSLA